MNEARPIRHRSDDDQWRAARAAGGPPCDGRCRVPLDDERARVLVLLQRHGRHATSFQILGPGFSYWFDPESAADAGGAVAYVEAAGYRVVAGPPVAPVGRRAEVAGRFVADTLAVGQRVVFFGVGDDFLNELSSAPPACGLDAIPIGVQAEFQPADYDLAGRRRRSLRAQVNRAGNHGVQVRRVRFGADAGGRAGVHAEVESVLGRWLAGRRMSVMRFLVDVHPFLCAAERRYYVAERDGRAVGFLAAVPVYARNGWFLEDVIRVPDAPNGTNEALIHAALDDARQSGAAYATLGLAPLAQIPAGPGPHGLLRAGLRRAYRSLGFLYGFHSLYTFKRRTRPDRWAPQHLIACPPRAGLGALRAVLAAFAGGGLLAFARDTVQRAAARVPRRAWAALLVTLALLLVPWTVLLALADGRRWFGDASIQTAWVAFDAGMVVGLAALARAVARRRRSVAAAATLLAGATATDALLTMVQALHLHRTASGWTALFVTAGILGPLLATGILALLAGASGLWARRAPT